MKFEEFINALAAARPMLKTSTDGAGAIRLYPTDETFDQVLAAAKEQGIKDCAGSTMHPVERETFCFCPITAVAFAETGRVFRIDSFDKAAEALGLNSEEWNGIVGAADCYTPRQLRPMYVEMDGKESRWGGAFGLDRFAIRAGLERALELRGGLTSSVNS